MARTGPRGGRFGGWRPVDWSEAVSAGWIRVRHGSMLLPGIEKRKSPTAGQGAFWRMVRECDGRALLFEAHEEPMLI
ncbi:hypothetical protein ACWEKM_07200 [Streptomyces sp. NPDC004752]